MSILGTWLAISAPWLTGLILVHRLSKLYSFSSLSAIICGSVGGLLSYLAVAGMFSLSKHFYFITVSADLRGMFSITSLLLIFYLMYGMRAVQLKLNRLELFLLLILLMCTTFTAALASLQPTFGWDTLSYWGQKSLTYLNTANRLHAEGAQVHSTHPHSASMLAAWSTSLRENFQAAGPIFGPWFLTWLSILITLVVYTYSHTLSKSLSLITAIAFSSVPLIGNHVVIGGYAELFVAATISTATALCSVALKENNKLAFIFGLIVALAAAFYKNIGYLYSVCVLTGYILSAAAVRAQSKLNLRRFVLFSCLTFLLMAVAIFYLNDNTITISIGNRWQIIEPRNLLSAPVNSFFSLFINQSFYQAGWLLIFAPLVLTTRRWNSFDLGPFFVVFLIFSLLLISQASEYSFTHSTPQSDTGLSRFSIIFITSAFLLVAPIYNLTAHVLQTKPKY